MASLGGLNKVVVSQIQAGPNWSLAWLMKKFKANLLSRSQKLGIDTHRRMNRFDKYKLLALPHAEAVSERL